MLRKEAQIKDLQTRVDNGDGSKLFVTVLFWIAHNISFKNSSSFFIVSLIFCGKIMLVKAQHWNRPKQKNNVH